MRGVKRVVINGWTIELNGSYAVIFSPQHRYRFVVVRGENVALPHVVPREVVTWLRFWGFNLFRRCKRSEKNRSLCAPWAV